MAERPFERSQSVNHARGRFAMDACELCKTKRLAVALLVTTAVILFLLWLGGQL